MARRGRHPARIGCGRRDARGARAAARGRVAGGVDVVGFGAFRFRLGRRRRGRVAPLEGAARARGFPRASGRPRRVGRVRVEFRRAEIAGVVRGGPPPRAVGRFTKNKKQRRGRRRRRAARVRPEGVHRVLPVPAPFSSAHAHDRDFAAAVGRGRARRVAARRGRGSCRAPARALRRSRAGVCEAGAGFVDARRLFAAQLLPRAHEAAGEPRADHARTRRGDAFGRTRYRDDERGVRGGSPANARRRRQPRRGVQSQISSASRRPGGGGESAEARPGGVRRAGRDDSSGYRARASRGVRASIGRRGHRGRAGGPNLRRAGLPRRAPRCRALPRDLRARRRERPGPRGQGQGAAGHTRAQYG